MSFKSVVSPPDQPFFDATQEYYRSLMQKIWADKVYGSVVQPNVQSETTTEDDKIKDKVTMNREDQFHLTSQFNLYQSQNTSLDQVPPQSFIPPSPLINTPESTALPVSLFQSNPYKLMQQLNSSGMERPLLPILPKKSKPIIAGHGRNWRFTPGQQVTCNCGQLFTSAESLEQHINCVHPENSNLMCSVCSKAVPNIVKLQRHMATHGDGIRKFKCAMCLKAFKFKHHLKEHERIHTGEKPFECQHCGKRFSHSGSYSSHTTSKKCQQQTGRRISHGDSGSKHTLQSFKNSSTNLLSNSPAALALAAAIAANKMSVPQSTWPHPALCNNRDSSTLMPITPPLTPLPKFGVNTHPLQHHQQQAHLHSLLFGNNQFYNSYLDKKIPIPAVQNSAFDLQLQLMRFGQSASNELVSSEAAAAYAAIRQEEELVDDEMKEDEDEDKTSNSNFELSNTLKHHIQEAARIAMFKHLIQDVKENATTVQNPEVNSTPNTAKLVCENECGTKPFNTLLDLEQHQTTCSSNSIGIKKWDSQYEESICSVDEIDHHDSNVNVNVNVSEADGSNNGDTNDCVTSSVSKSDERKVRVRTLISDEQQNILRIYYTYCKKPEKAVLEKIANDIGHPFRVVKVWFQNSRARDRRDGKYHYDQSPHLTKFPSSTSGLNDFVAAARFLARFPIMSNISTPSTDSSTTAQAISSDILKQQSNENKAYQIAAVPSTQDSNNIEQQPLDLSVKMSPFYLSNYKTTNSDKTCEKNVENLIKLNNSLTTTTWFSPHDSQVIKKQQKCENLKLAEKDNEETNEDVPSNNNYSLQKDKNAEIYKCKPQSQNNIIRNVF